MTNEVDTDQLWSNVLRSLNDDSRVSPRMRGFLQLAQPQGVLGDVMYLDVPNELTKEMIENRLRIPVIEALVDNNPAVQQVRVIVNDELDREDALETTPIPDSAPTSSAPTPEPLASTPSAAREPRVTEKSRLNPKYTFENFVIGGSNRFPHAAALAVAETPAKAYNPLFIHGDSGLGKTHLLHAIGLYSENMYPGIRVRYVSSEEFTNDFINSIANNQGQLFQARYRDVDVLLIDDIQFLQGKESTMEEFFHTFNTLHSRNKQIVITSDVQPSELQGFATRMTSRFGSGLTTSVQAPDLETRIAIVRRKASFEKLEVPDDVLTLVADRVRTNVRELEGTLLRVTAYASFSNEPVTMELAQTVLKDQLRLDDDTDISASDIIDHTASYFKLTEDDLFGSSRSQAIALARQIAMYLCRELTNLSLPKIGQIFGNRDHTTVMYAVKKIERLMRDQRPVYVQVTEITTRIKQGPRA